MKSFPEARQPAKRAANKAGLNVKQRIELTGKYSQEAKLKTQQARQQKKGFRIKVNPIVILIFYS